MSRFELPPFSHQLQIGVSKLHASCLISSLPNPLGIAGLMTTIAITMWGSYVLMRVIKRDMMQYETILG